MKKIVFALAALAFSLAFCKKEPDFSTKAFFECEDWKSLDSATVAQKLIGKWAWRAVQPGWGGDLDEKIGEGFALDIKSNGQLDVFQDGILKNSHDWSIEVQGGDQFLISTDAPADRVDGYILFCDDFLMFNGTPYDGNGNFYQKK